MEKAGTFLPVAKAFKNGAFAKVFLAFSSSLRPSVLHGSNLTMKIDIHTHTRKCKMGDAPTREITPEAFCETLMSTEVGIIAITNHNFFDLEQFNEINTKIGADAQVWPGIELDVLEEGARGQLIVIVSPSDAEVF